MPKKLIEVALPLEAINNESAREKSIRKGHPSTMHLWWARRPLATTRAVIWASLVDDPSSHPELFPTEQEQRKERERLFSILTELVKWENSNNDDVINRAKIEINKYNAGLPELLDPFSGGGAIPLEGQRLGLKVHAHDLNPVAVMINKAMEAIPARFCGVAPIHPSKQEKFGLNTKWKNATGLSEDIRYYGHLLENEAFKQLHNYYPTVSTQNGNKTVIAWLWARTVKCPNPNCGAEVPLVKTFDLAKKKGKESHIELETSGNIIQYRIKSGKASKPGTMTNAGAICPCCGAPIDFPYIREQGMNHKLGAQMTAIVAEGEHGRLYMEPSEEQIAIANVEKPVGYPEGTLNGKCRVSVPLYGLNDFHELYTNRQLMTLITFCNLIPKIQSLIYEDAIKAGMTNDDVSFEDGGLGAKAYSQALTVYLAFMIDKLADRCSSLCSWINGAKYEIVRNVFARQAIAMTWDYAEANPFSSSSGCFDNCINWVADSVELMPCGAEAEVNQYDAQRDCELRNILVSTDPPYYDNIEYADLSDYFYIWLRKNLKAYFPKLFSTMLVPKADELVATPYKFNGDSIAAKNFFETGMLTACKLMYTYSSDSIPVTIYYAYKQSNSSSTDEKTSTGWETMLSAIIKAGFTITGTWPVRTEMIGRSVGNGTNALASSIVLVCRKRKENAPVCAKREFVIELKKEFKTALSKLKQANIAPVDMAQSAIGPGIAVFSKYSEVLESDGTPMSVRSALSIINEEIDTYFNENDSSLDSNSRFCVDLYTQSTFNEIPYGDADTLARAKNISVTELAKIGIIKAEKGRVCLKTRDEIPPFSINQPSCNWLIAQQMTYAMSTGGIEKTSIIVGSIDESLAEKAKDLVYRLYTIADKKGNAQEAYDYNNLVVAWPDVLALAMKNRQEHHEQQKLFD